MFASTDCSLHVLNLLYVLFTLKLLDGISGSESWDHESESNKEMEFYFNSNDFYLDISQLVRFSLGDWSLCEKSSLKAFDSRISVQQLKFKVFDSPFPEGY